MTYDTPLTLQACAKINLFLDITGRRPDGYHLLTGVMQSVSLADTVTISLSPADEDSVRLTCSDRALPTDRGNLAFRAAEAFLAHTRADGGRKRRFGQPYTSKSISHTRQVWQAEAPMPPPFCAD